MAAAEHPGLHTQSFVVQCSPENFIHAAWLSAVHSEVIAVDEDGHRLSIYPMTELLRSQFERLGAVVRSEG